TLGLLYDLHAGCLQPLSHGSARFSRTLYAEHVTLAGPPRIKRRQRPLALDAVPLFFVADLLAQLFFERLQKVEGDIRRLESFRIGMRDVVHQRTERCRTRHRSGLLAMNNRSSRIEPGQHTGGNRFCVSLDTGDLAGEEEGRLLLQSQALIQQSRSADIGTAMNLAVTKKPRILQARNEPKHTGLLAVLEVILKADQVIAVGA